MFECASNLSIEWSVIRQGDTPSLWSAPTLISQWRSRYLLTSWYGPKTEEVMRRVLDLELSTEERPQRALGEILSAEDTCVG